MSEKINETYKNIIEKRCDVLTENLDDLHAFIGNLFKEMKVKIALIKSDIEAMKK